MKLITQCSDCSIKLFMSAKYDGNLKGLIIEGKPTKEELLQALEDLETEFNDLTGNLPHELKQINKVNALIARNKCVELCFFAVDECLRRANIPCPDALPLLKSNGINIKWNNDIEDYKKQVKEAKIRDISKQVELEELTKELEKVQKKSTLAPKFTKKNFYQLIHAVQALGFKVSETETNMFSFGVMCEQYFTMTKKQPGS